MDALTNVVAVLIFVLLLVNCDVSQKVVKMMEGLVPVTEEEMSKIKELLKNLELDKKKLEDLKNQKPPSQDEIDAMQKALQMMQEQLKNKKSQIDLNNKSIEELQKLHDQTLAERDAEKKETDELMAEIERLEMLLDTTPVAKDIPATEITIPATRSIPEDAYVYYAYVADDRVHLLDPLKIDKLALEEVNKNKKNLLAPKEEKEEDKDKDKEKSRDRKSKKDQEDKPPLLDQAKTMDFLSKLDFKLPPGQRLTFAIAPWSEKFGYRLVPDYRNGGTTLEELKNPNNAFAQSLSRIRPPNEVVIFRVSPESMMTYALARDFVENRKIPCGWEVVDRRHVDGSRRTEFSKGLEGFRGKPTGTPPPRDPNWKPPEKARGTGPKLD
jgi:TolA-binding protein